MTTLATAAPATSSRANKRVSICVHRPDAEPQTVVVTQERATIGAAPKANIRITGEGVAPVHCVLLQTEDGLRVRRWAEGATINGESFEETSLHVGDQLCVGEFQLELLDQADEAPERAATLRAGELPLYNADRSTLTVETVPVQLRQRLNSARGRVGKLADEVRSQRTAFQDLFAQRAALEESLAALKERQHGLEQQLIGSERERDAAQEAAAKLSSELDRIRDELNEANRRVEESKGSDHRAAEADELQLRVNELLQQQADHDEERQSWQAQQADLLEQRTALERQRGELESERRDLERLLRDREGDIEQLQLELKEASTRLENSPHMDQDSDAESQAQFARIEELEQQVALFDSQREAWLSERAELDQRVVETEASARQRDEDLAIARQRTSEAEAEREALALRLEQAESRMDELQHSLQDRNEIQNQDEQASSEPDDDGPFSTLPVDSESLEPNFIESDESNDSGADAEPIYGPLKLTALNTDVEPTSPEINEAPEDEVTDADTFTLEEQPETDSLDGLFVEPEPTKAPVSFISQYASLLDEDPEPEPQPSASPYQSRLNEGLHAPDAHVDDEDAAIEAYMSRLMQRVKDHHDPGAKLRQAPVLPKVQTEASKAAEAPVDEIASPKTEKVQPLRFEDIQKSSAPERSSDMGKLRDLANATARHAIDKAVLNKEKEDAVTHLAGCAIGLASGLYLVISASSLLSLHFGVGVLAFLTAAYWAVRTLLLLMNTIREQARLAPDDNEPGAPQPTDETAQAASLDVQEPASLEAEASAIATPLGGAEFQDELVEQPLAYAPRTNADESASENGLQGEATEELGNESEAEVASAEPEDEAANTHEPSIAEGAELGETDSREQGRLTQPILRD